MEGGGGGGGGGEGMGGGDRGGGGDGEREGDEGRGGGERGEQRVYFSDTLGYSTNLDEYLTRISKSHDFQPHGKLLHVYTRDDTKYEVYKVRSRIQLQPHLTL